MAAQTLEAIFYSGEQARTPHTPGGAVINGKIVNLGSAFIGIVTTTGGLEASRLGSVATTGNWKVKKAVSGGVTYAVGVDVFWDTVNLTAVAAAGANIILLGKCIEAAINADNHVKTMLVPTLQAALIDT